MNERIKELAEQSLPNVKFWNEEITKGNTPPKGRAITLDELEKFVELIVHRCMNICEQQRLKILNNPNDPSWTEHLAECQTAMEQMILKDDV